MYLGQFWPYPSSKFLPKTLDSFRTIYSNASCLLLECPCDWLTVSLCLVMRFIQNIRSKTSLWRRPIDKYHNLTHLMSDKAERWRLMLNISFLPSFLSPDIRKCRELNYVTQITQFNYPRYQEIRSNAEIPWLLNMNNGIWKIDIL